MTSFLLLIICLLLGSLVARIGNHPKDLHKHLNWWVLYIALPALVLEIIPKLQFDASLWFIFVSMWGVFGSAWLLFHWLGGQLGWSRSVIGATVLMTGLSNTAFVGLPMIEALRGKSALPYAAVADQLGCFLAVAIGGAWVVATYTNKRAHAAEIARRVLLFPPFIALITAVLIKLSFGAPPLLETVMSRISGTLAPLALFSVGLQLRLPRDRGHALPFALALSWKLALAPLLIYGSATLFGITPTIANITVLQSAMPSNIAAAILAEQNELDPPLANILVGVSILLSFITVPIWNHLLTN